MTTASTLLRSCLSATALGALLIAQGPDPSTVPGAEPAAPGDAVLTTLPPGMTAGIWRSPIHTQQQDERLGAYGLWASGDAYKVSFHDGFVFYPYLGPDYPENLPVRWRTERVLAASVPIADPLDSVVRHHTDWRCEYRQAGFVEAYDVRPEGVEQSFLIERRPARLGDLVVEGRFETPLRPTAGRIDAAHQDIVFLDANGTPIVRYGAAFAIDAKGDRIAVATELEGQRVRLVVPGAWLEGAAFPVLVDPLTSRIVTSGTDGGTPDSPAIHREDESPLLNTMVVVARHFSAGDYDVYARLGTADFTDSFPVFTDITTSWSSLLPDVTFVGGADRWVIGFWRHFPSADAVRAYFHDRENTSLNSGFVATNHNPTGEHATFQSVGGRSHPTQGTTALMAYRSDPFFGNSTTTQIYGVVLDAAARTFGGRTLLSPFGYDAEAPSVNSQIGWGDDGWIVAFQARTSEIDDYDVYVARVGENNLAVPGFTIVGPDNLGDKVRPVVEGWDGRYVVAMLQDATPEINGQHFGRNILAERFDWRTVRDQPNRFPYRTVAQSPNQDLTRLNLGFDGVDQSHWCLVNDETVFTAPRVRVRRLGYSAGVTETTIADQGATTRYHGAVTWNGVAREFAIVYCSNEASSPVYGQRLQYPLNSWNLVYGPSCGPGQIGTDVMPYAGTQHYRVTLSNAPPGQLAALWFAFDAGALDLGPFGAPNCTINLGTIVAGFGTATSASGGATLTFTLPDVPLFQGDLYWQYGYVWPAAPTPLTLGVTRGMRSSVQ